jgi:hypothetical protein
MMHTRLARTVERLSLLTPQKAHSSVNAMRNPKIPKYRNIFPCYNNHPRPRLGRMMINYLPRLRPTHLQMNSLPKLMMPLKS